MAGALPECVGNKYEDRADGKLRSGNGHLHAGASVFGH